MTNTSGLGEQLRVSIAASAALPRLINGQAPLSIVSTIPHDLHRSRRAAISPYFSKSSIRRLEPVIAETLDNLLQRLDAAAKSGEVVPLSTAYKAVASDIITAYCFGESTGFLMRADYNSPFFEAVGKVFRICWLMTHVAWLGPLLNSIPTKVQVMLMPGMKSWYRSKQVSLYTLLSNFA